MSLIQVNTGIEIRNYGRWFTATSTYMCWIRPTFVRCPTCSMNMSHSLHFTPLHPTSLPHSLTTAKLGF